MNKLLKISSTIIINIYILSFILPAYAGFYENGCRYFSQKQYSKAKEMFLKTVEANENGNAYYFLGEIEKIQGNTNEAEEHYRMAITKKLSEKYLKMAYWNLIVILEQKGNLDETVAVCKELWKRTGDDGAKKKIEGLINKFLWTSDEEAKELYKNGIECKKQNKTEEAKNYFNDAIRKDSSFLAPKFELGLIMYNEDNLNYAISYLKDISDEIPFYSEVNVLLGDIYFEKQIYESSLNYFDKALTAGFFDKETEYNIKLKRATSYYRLKNPEKAKEEINGLLAIKKSMDVFLLLSTIQIEEKNYTDATITLGQAEKLDPKNLEIIYQSGSIYYKLNDKRYISQFEKLLDKVYSKESIADKYFKAFLLLYKYYFENSQNEKAAKILRILPENIKTTEVNLMAAKTFLKLENYDLVIEYYEKISLYNLTDDDKFNLCIAYAEKGFTDKAKQIIQNLYSLNNYAEKSKKISSLKPIIIEIENDKTRIKEEEEKRKREEERIRHEAEAARLQNLNNSQNSGVDPEPAVQADKPQNEINTDNNAEEKK